MLKETDFISKKEWERLNSSQKQQKVADLLVKGAKYPALNKMGASNNLISKVSRELKQNKTLKEDKENKILEVNKAINNLAKIEDVDKKVQKLDDALARLNKTEEEMDAIINEVIFLKNEVSAEILKEFKKKLKNGNLILDYNKIASEILKG